jgi:hypothetical protein
MIRSKASAALSRACLALALVLLAACGKSAPTHFYTLAPEPLPALPGGTSGAAEPGGGVKTRPAGPCPSLGIGPVDFPAYLDRNQVVTQGEDHRMFVAEFDQWIEPLQDNFKRTLLADLGTATCAKPLVMYPWPPGVRPDHQVVIQVRRFDGALGREAVLQADWSILDASGAILFWQTSQYREPLDGPGYAQLASAQSRAVARLAGDIAAKVNGL